MLTGVVFCQYKISRICEFNTPLINCLTDIDNDYQYLSRLTLCQPRGTVKVFDHHIYEYQKGLRSLILHTMSEKHRDAVEAKLLRLRIAYFIRSIYGGKINVFFGADACVDVIRSFGDKSLNEFSPEEDYILGSMLGYGLLDQCRRYMCKSAKRTGERKSA
jgi:hypothetical protein